MYSAIVLSRSENVCDSDLAALRHLLPSECTIMHLAQHDGRTDFSEAPSVDNLYAALAFDKLAGGAFDFIVLGPSVSAVGPGWLWSSVRAMSVWLNQNGQFLAETSPYEPEWAALIETLERTNSAKSLVKLSKTAILFTCGQTHFEPKFDKLFETMLANLRDAKSGALRYITASELLYLFHGGSRRASYCATALTTVCGQDTFPVYVDHGAANGVIASGLSLARSDIKSVTAVELAEKYIDMGEQVSDAATDGNMKLALSPTENYEYSEKVDLIGFIHMFFRVPVEARQIVVDRAWAALKPGGALLINEIVVSPAAGTTVYTTPLLSLDEFKGYFCSLGDAKLVTYGDRWKYATPLIDSKPETWTGEHVVIVRKPL